MSVPPSGNTSRYSTCSGGQVSPLANEIEDDAEIVSGEEHLREDDAALSVALSYDNQPCTDVTLTSVNIRHVRKQHTLWSKWMRPASVSWKGASSPVGASSARAATASQQSWTCSSAEASNVGA